MNEKALGTEKMFFIQYISFAAKQTMVVFAETINTFFW